MLALQTFLDTGRPVGFAPGALIGQPVVSSRHGLDRVQGEQAEEPSQRVPREEWSYSGGLTTEEHIGIS